MFKNEEHLEAFFDVGEQGHGHKGTVSALRGLINATYL